MVKLRKAKVKVGTKEVSVVMRGNRIVGGMGKVKSAARSEGIGTKSNKVPSSTLKDGRVHLVQKAARIGTTTGTHGG